jgi:pantothenate kinase-related protein Tda10
MATIVLLSCTKSKLDHKTPAQELYSPSPTFQKTLAYGKSLKPNAMYILSAKHHLVPLNKELAPYDLTLKDMPKDEKEKWGEEVMRQMKSRNIDPNKNKFIFLTGTEYMKPLLQYIPESNIETPLEGKRMGERMKWLNSQINKINEIFKKLKSLIYESIKK